MFYTVYKITNNITGKYYIGKHQTRNLDDGYMGSGKLIKRAIKKYGEENFTKECLFVFTTEQEMNDKEKELVIVSEETYNLCEGGQGGFGYINENNFYRIPIKILNEKRLEKIASNNEFKSVIVEHCKRNYDYDRLTTALKEKYPNGTFFGKIHSPETKDKIGIKNSISQKGERNSQYGKPRSEETKKKISDALKNRKYK